MIIATQRENRTPPRPTGVVGQFVVSKIDCQASLNHTDPLLPTGRIVDNNWAGRVKINPANLYDG